MPKFKEVDILNSNDIVYCEVLRVDFRYVKTRIIATDNKVFDVYIEATLLKENSRSYDYENIILSEMFRPKDIIKAKVVSVKQVGKTSSSNLVTISTADNELGVICAESELSECLMVPKSWKEFQCVKTNLKGSFLIYSHLILNIEKRKVAKPDYLE